MHPSTVIKVIIVTTLITGHITSVAINTIMRIKNTTITIIEGTVVVSTNIATLIGMMMMMTEVSSSGHSENVYCLVRLTIRSHAGGVGTREIYGQNDG